MVSRAVWPLLAAVTALGLASAASATTKTVVTAATPSWTQDDTRPGGSVQWTTAFHAPAGLGSGSLELATDDTTAAKAGLYTHAMSGTPLSGVTSLSYWTYQGTASSPSGDASYQLQVDVGDGTFTTLVYEPYWNGAPTPATWQPWDVGGVGAMFWSSHTTPDLGHGNLVAGAVGPPLYTLAQVRAMYPDATVLGIGVNVGTFNPSYDIGVDGVGFNDTTYNFEPGVCSTSTSGKTITLLADCTETTPFVVDDGFTLDGAGHTLTAADPSASRAFVGAAVQNTPGGTMDVKNLHVVGASSIVDCNTFTGIDFADGGGSVENTTIDNLLRGGYTGCQNGLGIHALNNGTMPVNLLVDGNTITRYNKNGITINGAIAATVTGNSVTGAGPLGSGYAAQNGIQVGFGASAVVSGNTVSGNWYTPKSDVACGLLFYQAGGVKQQGNTLFDNEINLCNAGRGGGKVSP
jgi:Right handed beta helix region